jgi:uncharacterized protein YndB with AHSA1/START domain
MAARSSVAAATVDRELVIVRVFDAPRRLVFKAWPQPEMLARWWGPRDFTLPSCKMDLRPGGAFRFLMRAPDGDHRLVGVYREIVEPERLAFTFAWEDADGNVGPETLVTVTLAEQGTGTKLTLHQALFESVTARDMHNTGWSQALDRLAAYLAHAA